MANENRLSPWAIGWLVLMILANLFTAYSLAMTIEDLVSHFDPRWRSPVSTLLPVMTGLAALNAVAAVLLLAFRLKIGLWIFIASALAALACNLMLQTGPASFVGLLGPVITYLFLRPRWSALR